MIIVVDSGSSKADWRIIEENGLKSVSTNGLNPVFRTQESIIQEVDEAFDEASVKQGASQIFFYGAGCWDEKRSHQLEAALGEVFPMAHIEVEHDLLGAARAVCRSQPGIACILGTGSNSCSYDGSDIVDNITNLSYLVGDEGSGSWLGKMLIRAYFYRELPSDLREAFEAEYPGGETEILANIYDKGTPNVYLASFTRFLATYREHAFIQRLLFDAFATFVDRHVRKYPGHMEMPIGFIGSVGFHFQDSIKLVLAERGMEPGLFIKKPIDNLVRFHEPSLSTN